MRYLSTLQCPHHPGSPLRDKVRLPSRQIDDARPTGFGEVAIDQLFGGEEFSNPRVRGKTIDVHEAVPTPPVTRCNLKYLGTNFFLGLPL